MSKFSESLAALGERALQKSRSLLQGRPAAYVAWGLAPLAVAVSFVAIGSGTPPSIPAIALATEPLYAAVVVDKPAMALALSVEFPTVGAQYTPGGSSDNTYDTAREYLGYYDAESCYSYNDAPSETPLVGQTAADYKRFDRIGAATARKCTNAYSGNFLNWASNSAIDMLRLALSGGDRYIDTPSLTILQRAVIPNGDPICMWNSSNFPSKRLSKDGGGAGSYWGAVPASMIANANGGDIYVANTLNRIYFGTSQTGSCTDNTGYRLGSTIGPITKQTVNRPVSSVLCSAENAFCTFSGTKMVWYGKKNGTTNNWYVAPAYNGVNCNSTTFGDPYPGQAKECYILDYSGTWTPPTTAGTFNTDGFFYARVQACNSSSGILQDTRNYNFCKQYPSGNYKPTGVIQKYSDQIRLAAFGYLLDQTASYSAGRYGGVLRAPMKYVGSKTYNIYGQDNTPSGGNPKAEWNANTGVFFDNPDSNATPAISGVINYLNKFGRTGPTPGVYKKYDPVGELHYEALRYLQGLQPSADAISGTITATMADGFPYFTTWTDPYGDGRSNTGDYSCLKSNIVVVGDINTHDGNRLPTASAANNIPDINYWRGIVQKFEKNTAGTYVDGQGNTQSISNPNTANNSVPSATTTSQIMGSAYWARTHDIRGTGWTADTAKQRPGLRVKTFLFDVNEYGAQNNATTRRTANQFFMAAKYGGFETDPANPGQKPYNVKGNPFKDQNNVNDNNVWQKAADPGEASTYYVYNTSKPSPARDVLTAFDEIFSRASTSARSVAGGGLSTGSKVTSNSISYSAKFDTSNWSGDVVAEPITQDASNNLVIGTQLWSAAQRLDNMISPAANRKIFVGPVGSTAATAFTWGAIDAALKAQLNKANPGAATDGLGADRLAFLRGDRTKEGAPFRVRSSLLGDIVNSNISYSGAPSKSFTGTGYAAFRAAYDSRTPAVFAGGNDGMLHAFNATTGDELFAYIPSWLGPKLSALTDPTFANNHQNYVDAPSVVSEAQVANSGASTDWKTVLVSGTGGGGSGVFALDVSNPANFTASNVMWEFTRADDEDMGQVVGEPKILKIKTSGTSSTVTYRWFAVVGSGVNNYVPDANNRFSSTGKPALFLLALDKPAGDAWSLGTNYYKISVPTDSSLALTNATGLTNFSALYGTQGEMTDIYMGDLHGALWRLKFAGKAPTDWNMDKLSYFDKGSAGSPVPYPLYIARTGDSTPKVQPIFAAPTPFAGPIVGGVESFYVVFGTGKYLESSDNISTTTQSVYAVYDNGSTTADNSPAGASVISGRGRLQAGTVNTSAKTITVGAFKWGRPTTNADTTSRAGWYFDLPVSGERIDQAALDLGTLYAAINSKIPGSTSAGAGSCANTLGSGNQYFLSINSGSGSYVPSTLGLLGPPVLLSSDSETVVTPSDSTGRRLRTTTLRRFTQAQSGIDTSAPPVTTKETIGRLNWRQIFNYQDMKNAP
ncbi:PilC/PilY family type IV pilus protein [Acidovorax sp.]|uniref:pilus assembly protein n=1 Tax=Acidovorax sp. TaxID=1872122 RepID=UPI0031D91C11